MSGKYEDFEKITMSLERYENLINERDEALEERDIALDERALLLKPFYVKEEKTKDKGMELYITIDRRELEEILRCRDENEGFLFRKKKTVVSIKYL